MSLCMLLNMEWSLVITLLALFTELDLFSVLLLRPKLSALPTAVRGISFSGRSRVYPSASASLASVVFTLITELAENLLA